MNLSEEQSDGVRLYLFITKLVLDKSFKRKLYSLQFYIYRAISTEKYFYVRNQKNMASWLHMAIQSLGYTIFLLSQDHKYQVHASSISVKLCPKKLSEWSTHSVHI